MRRTFIAVALAAATLLCPAWAMADTDNQKLADSVATQLRDGGQLQDYEIGVKVNDGTVLLSGRVANQEQLRTALRTVSYMQGVKKVINRLTVAPSAKPAPAKKEPTLSQSLKSFFKTTPQKADRVASSYRNAPVRRTSATMVSPAPMVMSDDMVPMNRPAQPQYRVAQRPVPIASSYRGAPQGYQAPVASGVAQARFEQPCMPNYAWPSYAAYPNYSAVTVPRQYSPTAFPYIGPFYPYPQVPLGWRKVTLEWDDGWWWLDFKNKPCR
ncbi:MAG: BON domain-containing protein [Planctomycetia bacterium]|jgi:hypothetical protein